MKTINVNVYQYHELSEKAKEKAANWFLEYSGFDHEWDSLKEDAKNVGIELNEWQYARRIKGHLLLDPLTVIEKIMKEHGEECLTYGTAKKYKAKFNELTKTIKYPEGMTQAGEESVQELTEDFEMAILDEYRILADQEYEYTQSEEYIKDMMEANKYTFLENGERF